MPACGERLTGHRAGDDGASSPSKQSLRSLLGEGAKAAACIQFLSWVTSSARTGGTEVCAAAAQRTLNTRLPPCEPQTPRMRSPSPSAARWRGAHLHFTFPPRSGGDFSWPTPCGQLCPFPCLKGNSAVGTFPPTEKKKQEEKPVSRWLLRRSSTHHSSR